MSEKIENSIWDGAGNEIKVVTGEDQDGNVKQGTGATSEAAEKDLADPKNPLGHGFDTAPETRYSQEHHHANEDG